MSASTPEPDQRGFTIYVGQDDGGHWLVQDSGRRLEGCFRSRAAALSFARGEQQHYHGAMEICSAPLSPLISWPALGARNSASSHRN
jgi:hypothetical protein